jgi:class 3 adenylate cyclase/tetratricopeptide (TPR) repeat protein
MVNFGTARTVEHLKTHEHLRCAERRQVTVLACELVSEEDADADSVSCQLGRYRADVTQAVRHHGGRMIGDTGGIILAVWGSSGTFGPGDITGANSPRDALSAALDLAAQRYRAAKIQIAVDAGVVISNHNAVIDNRGGSGGDLVGRVLGHASALRAYSDDQTVVVSDAMRQLATDSFVFSRLEPGCTTIRFPIEPQLWCVTACKPRLQPQDRRAPRFIGNVCQQAVLGQALAAVLTKKRQIVIVTGEAGIGKSALSRHFRARVNVSAARWVEATCRPEQSHTTLQPIRDLLRHSLPKSDLDWLAETTTDTPPQIPFFVHLDVEDRQLLCRFFDAHSTRLRPYEPASSPIGGGSFLQDQGWPSDRRPRLVTLLIDIINYVASTHPTILAIEDLHWADSETLEFVDQLVERSASWPQLGILLIVRHRHHLPKRVVQRASIVTVERLSKNEIVDLLVGTDALPQSGPQLRPQLTTDTLDLIALRSEGVPLFAEQLAALYVNTADAAKASAILTTPTNLNLILAARLDALGDARSLAQSASILGRDFDVAVLARMLDRTPAHLQSDLAALVASGLVTPVSDRIYVTHRFSHALVRDAAYASLLRQRRCQLHASAADTLAQHFAMVAQTNPEVMAHHYSEAGAHVAAAQWWRLAADGALNLSQLGVAVAHLKRGLVMLALTSELPYEDFAPPGRDTIRPAPDAREEELAIRRLLGPCLTMLAGNGADAVVDNYRRCLALSAGLAPIPFEILWGLQGCHSVRGELADALEIGEQAIIVAEAESGSAIGEEQCLLAHRMQGLTRLQAGNIGVAIDHYREVERRYDPLRHDGMRFRYASDQGALAQAHWAWAEAVAGNLAASERLAERALARADQLEHPHTSAHVLAVLAARAQTLRQREVAALLAIAARTLAQAHGFTYWSAWAEIILGWHEAAHSPENSIERIERAIQDYRRTGAGQALPYAMLLKAEVALDAQLWDLAARASADGLKLARSGGLNLYTGELLRVRAISLMQSSTAFQPSLGKLVISTRWSTRETEQALTEAISISQQQGARIFAMRAAVTQLTGWAAHQRPDQDTVRARQHAAITLRQILAQIDATSTFAETSFFPEFSDALALLATI